MFLCKCIHSIRNQTYQNIEILLIDDGSDDESAHICDAQADEDHRIRPIHKLNGGVSSARNLGLDLANGKWIVFVDADDTIPSNSIEKLISVSGTETDVVIGDFDFDFEDASVQYHHPQMQNRNQFLEEYIDSDWCVCWGCLINNKTIKKYHLKFPDGLIYSEDFYFMTSLLLVSKRIKRITSSVYYYNRYNVNQATRKDKKHIYLEQLKGFSKCISDFHEYNDFYLICKGLYHKQMLAEQVLFKYPPFEINKYNRNLSKAKYIPSCLYMSKVMKITMLITSFGLGRMIRVFLILLSKFQHV